MSRVTSEPPSQQVAKNNFNGPPLKQMRLCPSDSILTQSTGASSSGRTFHSSSDHSEHVLLGRRRPISQAAACPRSNRRSSRIAERMRPSTTHATSQDAPPQPPILINTPPSHSRMLSRREEVIDLVTPPGINLATRPHTYPSPVATYNDVVSDSTYNTTRMRDSRVQDPNIRMAFEPVVPQVPTRNHQDVSNLSSSSLVHRGTLFGEDSGATLGVGNATAPFDYAAFAQMPPPLTSVYGSSSGASPVSVNPVNSVQSGNDYVPSHYQSVSLHNPTNLFLHDSTSRREATGFDENMSRYLRSRGHPNECILDRPPFRQLLQDDSGVVVPRYRHPLPSDDARNINQAVFGSHSRIQSQQGTGIVFHPSTSSSEQGHRDESVNVQPTTFGNTGPRSRTQNQQGTSVAFYPMTSTPEQVVPPAARLPAPRYTSSPNNLGRQRVDLDPSATFFASLLDSPTANRSTGHGGNFVPHSVTGSVAHPLNFQGASYSLHHNLPVDHSSQSPPSHLVPIPVISSVSHPQTLNRPHSVMSTQVASPSTPSLLHVPPRWDPLPPHPQPRPAYNGPFVLQTEMNRPPVNTTAHGEASGSSVITIAPPSRLRTRTRRPDSLQVGRGSSSAAGSGSTWSYDVEPIIVDDSSDSDDDDVVIVQGPTRLSAPSRTQVDIDEAYARELQAQFDRETSIFRIAQRPHQRPQSRTEDIPVVAAGPSIPRSTRNQDEDERDSPHPIRDNFDALASRVNHWTTQDAARFLSVASHFHNHHHRHRGRRTGMRSRRYNMMEGVSLMPPSFLLQTIMGSTPTLRVGNTYEDLLELAETLGPARPQGLSQTAINKLPAFTFKKEDENDDRKCVVCMCTYKEKEKVRTLPCVHEFHKGCIDTWLKEHKTCPICRVEVKPR